MTIELTTGVDRPPDRLDYCTKIAGMRSRRRGHALPDVDGVPQPRH